MRVSVIAAMAPMMIVGALACGVDPQPAEAPEAAVRSKAKSYIVDKDSLGGRCDDARTAARAHSASTPWCSLARALAAAEPGGTVLVRRGSYHQLVASGAARNLTVRGYRSEVPTLAGAVSVDSRGLRLRRMRLTDGVLIEGGSRKIHLVDNAIASVDSAVVLQDGASHVVVEGNRITSRRGSCVFFSSGPDEPAIVNAAIRRNVCHGAGVTGVNARNFRDLLIEGNEIKGITRWDGVVHTNAIRTYAGGSGLVVRNNFIHDNLAQGLFIKDGKVTDAVVENNVIARTQGSFKDVNIYDVEGLRMVNNTIWGKGMVFQGTATGVLLHNNILSNLATNANTPLSSANANYNLITSGLRVGSRDIAAPPDFVDPDRLDYRLAAGSPGIDAGTSDQAPTLDRRGRPRVDDPRVRNRGAGARPYYDIGAYELEAR